MIKTVFAAVLLMSMLSRWNTRALALAFTARDFSMRPQALRQGIRSPSRERKPLPQSCLFSQSTATPIAWLPNYRVEILHPRLITVGIDADSLLAATLKSIEDPTAGYDSKFGKSAIKTCRAFLFPKKSKDTEIQDGVLLAAAAARTARQIDFLIKRHKSHQTEWVRHHDVIRSRRQVFPLILILDNLRSAFNVGSMYRTADATGCQAVLTCGITPHPHGSGADKVGKSALGAELLVPSQHFATTQQAIEYLRVHEPEFCIIGMETTDKSDMYTNIAYASHPKIGLVLGNEVTGIDTTLLPTLDLLVEIPTFGAKNSLNVAACAPVVLYEILRQWNTEEPA